MSNKPNRPIESIDTGIYHDDVEVAVRSRSQYSTTAHLPETDGDGKPVFDDDHDEPVPQCNTPRDGDAWVLKSTRHCSNRHKCRRCFDAEDVAEQNSENAGSKTFARIARNGSDWGEKSSGTKSQSAGD